MRLRRFYEILLVSASWVLSACGGGAAGSSSIPAPSATPTPTPSSSATPGTAAAYIVAATGSNQAFVSRGGNLLLDPATGKTLEMSTADSDQLKVRYNSGSSAYEIDLPSSTAWQPISLASSEVPNTRDFRAAGRPVYLQLQQFAGTGYLYSALAGWGATTDVSSWQLGGVAFGIPTASGGVPVTGSASYAGSIVGNSTEASVDYLAGGYEAASVEGSINLSFNFGAGTLSGSISPTIYNFERRALPPMSFVNTVYASGATSFSGNFDTSLAGTNSFSGQFTGPQAQELIGSFAFPYTSPDDGKSYQANGAFVAKH